GRGAVGDVDQGEEAVWTEAGLRAVGDTATPANSPKYRYPAEAPRRLRDAAPAGADGMRVLRYVNPATGGAVMPTLDCYAARLSRGTPTRAKRTTYNVVCLVVTGEGRSRIGEETGEWLPQVVVTIPTWTLSVLPL